MALMLLTPYFARWT